MPCQAVEKMKMKNDDKVPHHNNTNVVLCAVSAYLVVNFLRASAMTNFLLLCHIFWLVPFR